MTNDCKQIKISKIIFEDGEYWIGLTDLVEGEYRWTFDQTKATFLTWHSGYGKRGNGSDCCGLHSGSKADWFDYSCNSKFYYLCESNFCEYNIIYLIYLYRT